MSFLTIFSVLLFLLSLCTLLFIFLGSRKMKSLGEMQANVLSAAPLVSIIVPACNEEATLDPALRSLLQQDYTNQEIIVIDDRSTDGTYDLLKSLTKLTTLG